MQEHIRRAHPQYYISKLPATEESFQLMISTPPSARPPSQQTPTPAASQSLGKPGKREVKSRKMTRLMVMTGYGHDRDQQTASPAPPRTVEEAYPAAATAAVALAQLHNQLPRGVEEWASDAVRHARRGPLHHKRKEADQNPLPTGSCLRHGPHAPANKLVARASPNTQPLSTPTGTSISVPTPTRGPTFATRPITSWTIDHSASNRPKSCQKKLANQCPQTQARTHQVKRVCPQNEHRRPQSVLCRASQRGEDGHGQSLGRLVGSSNICERSGLGPRSHTCKLQIYNLQAHNFTIQPLDPPLSFTTVCLFITHNPNLPIHLTKHTN